MTLSLPAEASTTTRPFWEAAAAGSLVRPVCGQCGRNFFIPQIACPDCHTEDWTYEQSSGKGVISTFTVVHRAPTDELEPPYVVAVVDLDEGWYMMTNIVDCPHESVRIGQAVEVDFQSRADGIVLPVFRPSGANPS
ncbi:Zn-ribbon domain-containing OB-fold protein [Elongatibacter sediminis]|uniref:Zn-ribbon domain-containing OB-fold protein n=1 Tax=Elongatibacter sediminis TaxID=3119006 RepID=A0AAW9RM52_9GAMM